MDLSFYSTSLATLRKQVSVLGVACLALSITVCVMSLSLSNVHDRIVVVPPGLSGPVAIDWGRADAEYLKTFGLFYATLLGSVTPRNAMFVADRLVGMTSSTLYPQVRKKILMVSSDPQFSGPGASANFISNAVVYEPSTSTIFIQGEMQYIYAFGGPKSAAIVYEIKASIVEGRPIVEALSNYPGTEIHTKEWKLANPDWNKKAPT